ncbi:MAG: DUF896 domain-containing protein [Clostridia bacterium]|nr:DUF896 domain-containing protein [Clostridia bacterium]MBQ4575943.1 DUF896 domain-containing protein [Clostridia bacterium]
MEQSKIDRINALARKLKSEGLTEEEHEERAQLHKEYIESYRRSLRGILDNTYIQHADGTKVKLKAKNEKEEG